MSWSSRNKDSIAFFCILLLLVLIPHGFTEASTTSCTFSQNLAVGSRTNDVTKLQKFLNSNPQTQVATSGSGSPGQETNYFGPATKKALIKYQELHRSEILVPSNLNVGTGFFGVLTRQVMSDECQNSSQQTSVQIPTNTSSPISQVSQPPVFTTMPPQTVAAGQSLSFTLQATSPLGDTITYAVEGSLNANSSLNPTTGVFTWNTQSWQSGQYSFLFQAKDQHNHISSMPVEITITTNPNNAAVSQNSVSNTTTVSNPPVVSGQSPLASLIAQLHPDDSVDDSATLQQIIDQANSLGVSSITLPAGTFKMGIGLHIYGKNLTISGQGDQTVFDFTGNYQGGAFQGTVLTVEPIFTATQGVTTIYNPSQPITGNTIVFNQSVPFQPGDILFVHDGRGATRLLERSLGGALDIPNEFYERAPGESVTVSSVTTNNQGQTIVTLTNPLIGVGEYTNVIPSNQPASENYLTVLAEAKEADHISIENLAIKFTNMNADMAFYTFYATNITVDHIHALNQTKAGGLGGMGAVGTTNISFTNITTPVGIGFNSTRLGTVSTSTVGDVTFEETSTDDTVQNNTIGTPGGSSWLPVRTGDLGCNRISILNNTIYAGTGNFGGIGIWEGRNVTIAGNTITSGSPVIWAGGMAPGLVVHDNTATLFADSDTHNAPNVYNNSWQLGAFNYVKSTMANIYQGFINSMVSIFGGKL